MGTLYATKIINRALRKLSDEGADFFERSVLFDNLNSARRIMVVIKPDTNGVITTFQLVEGTEQTLTGNGFILLDPVCNMGTDGNTVGRVIRMFEKKYLDREDPYWHMNDAAAEVLQIAYNPKTPRIFFTNPPQPAASQGHIKIIQAEAPADISPGSGGTYDVDVGFPEVYEDPLLNLLLFVTFHSLTTPEAKAKAAPYYNLAVAQLKGQEINEEEYSPKKEE